MERSILLISDNPNLLKRLKQIMTDWQVISSPTYLPDILLNRDSQTLILLDLDHFSELGQRPDTLFLMRQQFRGPLLAIHRQRLTAAMICDIFERFHFDELLSLEMSNRELHARIQQKIWRYYQPQEESREILNTGQLQVDFQHYMVSVAGRKLTMGPVDFRLLVYFMQHENVVLTRAQIAEGVWRNGRDSTMRAIDSHISKLRKLIEEDAKQPQYLQTIRGFGYIFKTVPEHTQEAE
ncbi:winged helix family transcriptional regulator [Secundilactobacillus odoratitofui DSM 19909 = JCM 15043]|uniref:Winged helix family transcriptional regulator n=1 Tax=Secundilactobacillus odoratitofui DSM 19909 = JCM 15043 TaxID=1423776 RepID=A0A0R1LU49_9LACO|nr:response regulator transcription factor [Secundilactobacillus odoratitofui]KRK98992.1 winged helix family transcriptional regulator [Secundilactobacillus odoratitofui DSM 19909 = JCM 15043]